MNKKLLTSLILVLICSNICAQVTRNGRRALVDLFRQRTNDEMIYMEKELILCYDGYAYIKLRKDSLEGINSLSGKVIVPIKYKHVSYHEDHYFKVHDENYDKVGVYTCDGKYIIPIERGYDYVYLWDSMNDGYYWRLENKGKMSSCDTRGREIPRNNPAYDNQLHSDLLYCESNHQYEIMVSRLIKKKKNLFLLKKGDKYGLMDRSAKMIIPIEMDSIAPASDNLLGYVKYKSNGFWGVMGTNIGERKIIIPPERGYSSIGDFDAFTSTFHYTIDKYEGDCDKNGIEISRKKLKKK